MPSHENKEYFDKISVSVLYSVCPSCHYRIGFDNVCGFRFTRELSTLYFERYFEHERARYCINRIYNKILDRDWFYARLFLTYLGGHHVGGQLQISNLNVSYHN